MCMDAFTTIDTLLKVERTANTTTFVSCVSGNRRPDERVYVEDSLRVRITIYIITVRRIRSSSTTPLLLVVLLVYPTGEVPVVICEGDENREIVLSELQVFQVDVVIFFFIYSLCSLVLYPKLKPSRIIVK